MIFPLNNLELLVAFGQLLENIQTIYVIASQYSILF